MYRLPAYLPLHQGGTFVTMDETTWTCHNHPKSTVTIRCCAFLGQMYNDMYSPLWYPAEYIYDPKNSLYSAFSSTLPPIILDHHWSIYCLYTSIFSRMSYLSCCHSVSKSCPTLGILWTPAPQASLSFTISQSLLKFMSIESVMLSNHLILCCPLLLLPSNFPSIRVFDTESALHIDDQSIGASATTSVLPMSIQCWFPLKLIWSKGL